MNKDAISRCELFNRLATLPAPAEANNFKAEVYKIIQEMETEDRPQGEWINHSDDLFPEESTIECSVCHEHQPVGIDDNYCPNCGAVMQKERQ